MRFLYAFTLFALLASGMGHAQNTLDASLFEEVVQVPLTQEAADAPPLSITATLFRPPGAGPFPLLILSHGNPPSAAERPKIERYRKITQIREFLRRGYVVMVPIRRGYGATGGEFVESYAKCNTASFTKAGLAGAQDLLAAIDYARKLPYVDAKRIVLAGQSAGGFASLAAASLQPAGLQFVLNFSGGRGGDPVKHPAVPCGANAMGETIAGFARNTSVPVLFHYVENDMFFGPEYTRAWFAAFEQAGGKGQYVLQAPFGRDGHGLFASDKGLTIWTSALDDFVRNFVPQ